MKKIICLMLAVLMIFSMVACGNVNDSSDDSEETTKKEVTTLKDSEDDKEDDEPTTEAPTTEAPTTEAPTTEAPTTEDPTTEEPTTEEPTTEEPTTEEPTTEEPTTEEPTTEEPTTEEPTTEEPTTEEPTTEESTTEEPTTEETTTEPPVTEAPEDTYDGVFQTGYSRVVITPNTPVEGFQKVLDDLYATCLAVYDGGKTAIFISLDLKSLMPDYCESVQKKVNAATKVPMENIFVSVTHTHSTIEIGDSSTWAFNVYNKVANAAKAAIKDLGDTEMFVGTGSTPGASFVRRYINSDGTMSSISPSEEGSVACVSEADDSLQVVRFVREDKKDIVLTNWQGHLAHAENYMPETISADIAHYLREDIEAADDDALVILFVGASGNLNLNPPNEESRVYNDYIEVAKAIAAETVRVLKNDLTKISAGKIVIEREAYKAQNGQETAEEVAAAQDRLNRHEGTSHELIRDRYIVARNKSKTSTLNIAAVSLGDLAFVTAPYEMFDNNGVQIKEGSPFKMTIVATNAGGAWAYMPSIEAWEIYGGYETWATYFAPGVAEKLVDRFLDLLNKVNVA